MSGEAIHVAVQAAQAGGRVLMESPHSELEVRLKDSRANLVTSADKESQEAVVAVIREAFPDHAVVGEEGKAGDPRSQFRWLVDPLDGTTNYANGLGYFCVSVALQCHDDTVCAAVFDPYHEELFTAQRGQGATCNGRRLRVANVERLAESLVVAQAQSSDPAEIADFTRLFELLMNTTRGVRFPGAPALALCHVAAGRITAYCERAMDPWDTAAGQLILEESGGRFTTFDGRGVRSIEPTDVVGSNRLIHDELLATLHGHIRNEERGSHGQR